MNLLLIFSNILGYDMLIIVLAVFNIFILLRLNRHSDELYELLNPTIYIPIEKLLNNTQEDNSKELNFHYIRILKEKETKYYNLFTSITSIFPLLGILGTIISLLKLITFTNQEVMMSFSTALTSTFWGLIFAIIYKALGGIMSSKTETNKEILNLLFNRIDEYTSK